MFQLLVEFGLSVAVRPVGLGFCVIGRACAWTTIFSFRVFAEFGKVGPSFALCFSLFAVFVP